MMSFRTLQPTATSLTSSAATPSLLGPVTCASAKEDDMASAPETRTRLGVAAEEVKLVAVGWSVRKDIIGKTVYNESGERMGTIEDLIVAQDSAVSFAIVG